MVPTAGVEPAQVAPLAPQTSASTNFATSVCYCAPPNFSMVFAHLATGFAERTPTIMRRCAPIRQRQNQKQKTFPVNSLLQNGYFGGVLPAGGGVGAGAGAVAGAGVVSGAGAVAGGFAAAAAAAAACAARSNTLVGSDTGGAPR